MENFPCAPADAHGERAEPGGPGPLRLDGFLLPEPERGPPLLATDSGSACASGPSDAATAIAVDLDFLRSVLRSGESGHFSPTADRFRGRMFWFKRNRLSGS